MSRRHLGIFIGGIVLLAIGVGVAGILSQQGRSEAPSRPQSREIERSQLGSATSTKEPPSDRGTLAELCQSSVGSEGFANVEVATSLTIESQSLEIGVPCGIRFLAGGSLSLKGVRLTTKHLSIRDQRPNGKSSVQIVDSTLGGDGAGFLIDLLDREDSIEIRGSTFEYPLSVWLRIFGRGESGEGGGFLRLVNSEFTSVDPQTEGITVAVSEHNGVAHFERLSFRNSKGESLLWAGSCYSMDISGAQPRCFRKLSTPP